MSRSAQLAAVHRRIRVAKEEDVAVVLRDLQHSAAIVLGDDADAPPVKDDERLRMTHDHCSRLRIPITHGLWVGMERGREESGKAQKKKMARPCFPPPLFIHRPWDHVKRPTVFLLRHVAAAWAPRLSQRQVEEVLDQLFFEPRSSPSGAWLAIFAVLAEAK